MVMLVARENLSKLFCGTLGIATGMNSAFSAPRIAVVALHRFSDQYCAG
jgi:hypothetical protein